MEGLSAWAEAPQRLWWEARRALASFRRAFGAPGFVVIGCLVAAAAGVALQRSEQDTLAKLRQQMQAQRQQPQVRPGDAAVEGARARLAAFERHLLPYEDIPQAVQDLLDLAAAEGLVVAKGDYRPQVDTQGGFVRYRMSLPLRGDAAMVQRFMMKALQAQKTLTLESISFKREQIASNEVDARIQWLLITRFPTRGPAGTLEALAPTAQGDQR